MENVTVDLKEQI